MINLTHEEAQQVLDALNTVYGAPRYEASKILRAKLAQPELKDDGYCKACEGNHCTAKAGCVALSNPPQREWVGLTDEEIRQARDIVDGEYKMPNAWARAIEAKLKEKNAND